MSTERWVVSRSAMRTSTGSRTRCCVEGSAARERSDHLAAHPGRPQRLPCRLRRHDVEQGHCCLWRSVVRAIPGGYGATDNPSLFSPVGSSVP